MKMKGILKRLATLTIMAALVLCLLPLGASADYELSSTELINGTRIISKGTSDSDYGVEYTIITLPSEGNNGTVSVSGYTINGSDVKVVTIPSTITVNDQTFEVIAIVDDAFKGTSAICATHRFDAESDGTCKVCDHVCQHSDKTAATCVEAAKCIACGMIFGEADRNAHNYTWTYENGNHKGVCSYNDQHIKFGNCEPGEDGKCTVCQTALVASLTSGDTTTYYKTVDEAFAAAQAAGSGTVTVLAHAEYTTADDIIYSENISLVVNPNVTLTTEAFLRLCGSISGGGTIAGTNQGWLVAYAGSTIDGITATARLNIAGGTILSGTFDGEVQSEGTIKGGTFSGMVYNSGTIEGGTFNKTVVNHDYYSESWAGTISGGTFNCTVENIPGTINGGTFNGQLTNKPYDKYESYVAATVDADNLMLGENFRFTNQGGTVNCTTHQRTTPATCMAPETCIFCGHTKGEKDNTAHSLSYTVADNVITETCAHGCTHSATATLDISTDSVTYNGAAQTIATVTHSATWRGERLTAQYENNTNVGTATVYIQAGEAKAVKTFAITKATPTLEHFDITLPQNAVYDGTEKAATIDPKAGVEGMGEVSIKYYQGEKELNETPTNAGTYTVEFTVTEGSNYLPAKLLAGSFNIAKAEAITTAPTANTLTYNSKPQQLVSGGISNWGSIEYKLDNGDWSYSIPTATNAGSYTVYYRIQLGENFNNVAETAIPVELAPFNFATATAGNAKIGLLGTPFVYDGTAKTGTPSVVVTLPSADPGSSSIEVNLTEGTDFTVDYENNVKAGTFTATFTGKGNYTGVVTRNYEIAKAPLTLKVEDQTITYGESIDQAEYTVEGLADGDKATVKLTPSTTNITESGTITAEITIKNAAGEDVTGCYDISKNSGKLTIDPDLSAIKDLTVDNVHHSNEEDIKAVQDMLDKAEADVKNDQNITEAQQKCANLLVQIHESLDALRTDAIEDTLGTTASNVKLADKATINEAIGDIKEAKTNYAGNYSEADIAALDAQIANLEAALDAIEKAETVIDWMNGLPADVEPDDDDAITAKAAYDELTSNEKNMVASATATKLAALSTYKIVKGDKATWEKGKTLTFTINGDINRFTGVKVNGSTVNSKYYTAKAGSTIVTLEKSFFEQKSISSKATHEIIFMFGDGEVRGTFYIHKDAMTPATGDSSGIVLWTVILFASTAALAAVIVISRKRKNA